MRAADGAQGHAGRVPDGAAACPPRRRGSAGPIGLGFRVPMLVVSPFSRGGLVCSDTFDHTSTLRFLETRFGAEVPNLSALAAQGHRRPDQRLQLRRAAQLGEPSLAQPGEPLTCAAGFQPRAAHSGSVPQAGQGQAPAAERDRRRQVAAAVGLREGLSLGVRIADHTDAMRPPHPISLVQGRPGWLKSPRWRTRSSGLVSDGDSVALEGFTHLIPFAAGHELLRQGRRELELIRMTPDVLYDQMIGMGAARRLVFSYGGNPGVGSLHRFRDAIEHGWPRADRARGAQPRRHGEPLRGGRGAPAVRGDARLRGHRPGAAHANVAPITCPFTGEELIAVPALRPDVAIIHAQEADREGNVQLWGIPGVQKEAVLAADRSLVTVERIVERLEPRPGGVVIPGLGDRRVARRRPGGSRPSYSLGITERDNDFYRLWDEISRDRDAFAAWMRRARARPSGQAMSAPRPSRPRRTGEVQTIVAARRLREHAHRSSSASGGRARRRSSRGWSTTRSWCSSTSRARSAPSRSTCRSRSATASSPRPPTRSSRCRRCSTTGSGPAGSRSRSSARRRSTAYAT